MTEFTVVGPLGVSYYSGKGGRTIRDEDVEKFWDTYRRYKKRRGCFVFAMRAGKGFTPGYVGKATKKLQQEVFAHHKLTRYQQFLAEYARGTPVMFFILAPERQGKPNNSQIGQVEKYLIDLALTANPDLLNEKGRNRAKWGIKGVIRGGKGKTSRGTKDFRRMLDIT
jgi:hypothetical protein